MSTTDRLQPDTINHHVANVYPALAMLAGMQLEVFTPLGDGPKTVDEVAAALGVKAVKLRPLMYALVTAGMLTLEGGRFANTPEAQEFLVKGGPRYLGEIAGAYSDLWSSTMHTAASIRSGRPQAKHDFANMTKEELSGFIRGMDAGASAAARRLNKEFDLAHKRRLLDAGGGSGGLSAALCQLCPALRATVAELPSVAAITRDCIAEAGLESRIEVCDVDLVNGTLPGGYDVAALRSVLQVMSAEDAARTVLNVAAALDPGGVLFAVGRMLDDTRLAPADAVAANVMFLNVYEDGQAYTESEYRGWFEAAGLTDLARLPMAGGYSIYSGRKA
jgi:hypothetical protein